MKAGATATGQPQYRNEDRLQLHREHPDDRQRGCPGFDELAGRQTGIDDDRRARSQPANINDAGRAGNRQAGRRRPRTDFTTGTVGRDRNAKPLMLTIVVGARFTAVTVLVTALASCSPPPSPVPSSSSPIAAISSTPAVTSSPSAPPTQSVLPYRADWSAGAAGWTGSDDWTAMGGQLHSDGTSYGNGAGMVAPLDLTGVGDYAVDAEIQLLRNSDEGMFSGLASFGVVVQMGEDGRGYTAGPCVSSGIYTCAPDQPTQRVAGLWADGGNTTLDVRPFRPRTDWHHYRVEVRGNTLKVLIDEAFALSATDNTHLRGRKVGLWSNRSQISVRSFEVTAL